MNEFLIEFPAIQIIKYATIAFLAATGVLLWLNKGDSNPHFRRPLISMAAFNDGNTTLMPRQDLTSKTLTLVTSKISECPKNKRLSTIISMSGRLGNQMMNYAALVTISKQLGYQPFLRMASLLLLKPQYFMCLKFVARELYKGVL